MTSMEFRESVIKPTLEKMGLWSESAESLILGTAIQESRLKYRKQIGGGPALGLFQMEPFTHDSIRKDYLDYRSELKEKVDQFTDNPVAEELENNDEYACAMCRIHYLRVKESLPAAHDILGAANYWKSHYNTPKGAGTVSEFVENYERARHGLDGN